MKQQKVAPTGIAQEFEINETFFSSTNPKGIITSGNDVFCRVSDYSLEEMVGQPHNIIRHPSMPRLVFRMLWQTVREGEPFVGYVLNHAGNGNHYWVLAIITGITDGYLSIRIKPSSGVFGVIPDLYGKLLQLEEEQIATGAEQDTAIQASASLLETELQGLGYADYSQFSRHALNTEISSRDNAIRQRHLSLFSRRLQTDGTELGRKLQLAHNKALEAYDEFSRISEHLGQFIKLSAGIQEKQVAVQEISEDFMLKALNASLSANQLGAKGATIGKVTEFLHDYAHSLSGSVKALSSRIGETTLSIGTLLSRLAISRLGIEMLLNFVPEMSKGNQASAGSRDFVMMGRNLVAALSKTMQESLRYMGEIKDQLPRIEGEQVKIRKLIINLNVAQISGLMESQRSEEARQLISMFSELRDRVEIANNELAHFESIVANIMELTQATSIDMQRLETTLDGIQL